MTANDTPRGTTDLVSRRRYLALKATATTGLVAGCTGLGGDDDEGTGDDGETGNGDDPFDTTITLDADDRGDWTVPEELFGRFAEHYGDHEAYPGMYAEHVTNTSFVAWPQIQGNVSHVYGFDRVGEYDDVPFPWEPLGEDANLERPSDGGVRGYGTWDSDGDWPSVGRESADAYQRVVLEDATGGLRQQVVLPDWRTLSYEFALSARSAGEGSIDSLEIRLTGPDGDDDADSDDALASATINGLTDEWDRYEVDLELREQSGSVLEGGARGDFASPYGEYVLEIVADGTGTVDLDWISLIPADAVEGERTGARFNPTTIELMDDRNVSLLKWPGGNVTSTYKWEDAVGPIEERPIRPNVVWDGLDPNLMGTAEYVEFCEFTDVEPTITVGVTVPPEDGGRDLQPPEPITPEDAANWVEYCNGDTDTEYGALRADHGYEEPFDVEVWEVGNEVWGGWQFGGTDDAEAFARRANEFVDAMTAVDDSITVIPDGMDPKYDDPNLPNPREWNQTLFEIVGENLDGIGMHRYNWGIRDTTEIANWKGRNDADALDYNEVLISFPTQFGDLLSETANEAAEAGLEEFQIMVGEWGLFPTVGQGDPWPGMPTMAGASYVAGMYNAFVRESDVLRRGCHTHLPVRMFPPEHADHPANPNPLLPVGYTLGLYATVFEGDEEWSVVESAVDGETRDIPETGHRIRAMDDVSYVDTVTVVTAEDDACCTFLTNRNLRAGTDVTIDVPEAFEGTEATVTVQQPTDDPHAMQNGLGEFPDSWYDWTGLEGYETDEYEDAVDEDGSVTVHLEPSAVARVRLE
ncbi:alpha-L-arabinofuranosidase [Halobacteria archaeon AArc-m2/3/4]|uniref:Alpha-L-arabinofuranosidase n=1 Tax=Natronoglomus mannanivorans TaxID=2979990 RepID=A0ABT2QJY3_9EURY|nr:alpha-L-arabinofuranosidase [Halobacteria archaeon AArc-m2/3/4]